MSKVRAPVLILPDQDLDIHHKRTAAKGPTDRISKASEKKVMGLGTRKALRNVSNVSSRRQEASKTKKNHIEECSFAEEMFLHDHKRCIEAQKAEMNKHFLDVLRFETGLDLLSPATSPKSKQAEVGCGSPPSPSPRYLELELVPELQMPAVDYQCPSSIQWDSPPPSPSRYELPELVLKSFIDN